MPKQPDPLYISKPQLAKLLCVTVRTVDRWEEEPGFPQRIKLGAKSVLYRYAEVIAWVESRAVKKPEPRLRVAR